MTPTEIVKFIAMIAAFTKDGECTVHDEDCGCDDDDCERFILENDDAVDTLHDLIDEARRLQYHYPDGKPRSDGPEGGTAPLDGPAKIPDVGPSGF